MGSRQRNKACFANAQEISRSLKNPKVVLPGDRQTSTISTQGRSALLPLNVFLVLFPSFG